MTILFEPAWFWGGLILAAGPLALNAYVLRHLRHIATAAEVSRLGRLATAADTAGTVVLFLLFLGDAGAMPIAFTPFLVFELSIRHGARGIVAGLGVFAAALATRIYAQTLLIDGGAVRPHLLILWISLVILMIGLSRELRVREEARVAAQRERERIAAGFRHTVHEMLSRSGIPLDAASRADVLAALERIYEEGAAPAREPAHRIADLIAAGASETILKGLA